MPRGHFERPWAFCPQQILVVGDHLNDLPMMDQRYMRDIWPARAMRWMK